jgi:biopolymer transport protein ExbB
MAAVQDTLWEHIRKGGVVMFPIFVLAGAALLVALYKWLRLLFVARPSRRAVAAVLDAVAHGDDERAAQAARALRGPTGAMLTAGTEHLGEPRALIEEVMYEKVLATRLGLNRWLPFIAITASSAPLLGLLGTVTGIMNTFTLMTVFGTGDVKTLSSGISEALITTEFGLYVAIPALLLYAFLSRKARSIVDGMEQAAVALLNEVSRSEARAASGQNGREPRSEPRDGADRRTKPTRVESLA